MVAIIAKDYKQTFQQIDKGLQGFERGFRLLQGLAQLGTALGWNGKMIGPLSKTLNLTRIADRCLDIRMAILALEIVKDPVRFNYHMMFGDARSKKLKQDGSLTDQTRQFLTSENTLGVACLVLDLGLASSFFTNQIPLLPKGMVTNALSTALNPAMFTVFVMCYATLHHKYEMDHQESSRIERNKFALDLVAALFPLLLPNHCGGSTWQRPLFNVTTGAVGAYVTWQNFPASQT